MINGALYAIVVLFLGGSWIAVKWQVGVVPESQSVAYRFAIAAALVFLWAALRRERVAVPLAMHPRLALLGATMFSLNFFQVYNATNYVTTGLIAVAFSTTSAFVAVLGAVFLKQRAPARVWAGVVLGIAGTLLIFRPEVGQLDLGDDGAVGLALAMSATITFSIGTVVSGHIRAAGLPVLPTTAWGMTYGTLLLVAISAVSGGAPAFDTRLPYVASFLYLTLFAAVISFACYLSLVQRIGATRASYTTVLFPVVALALSTLFEGYEWTVMAAAGVALVLAGNVLVLTPGRRAPATA